jgi:hypothetical protein
MALVNPSERAKLGMAPEPISKFANFYEPFDRGQNIESQGHVVAESSREFRESVSSTPGFRVVGRKSSEFGPVQAIDVDVLVGQEVAGYAYNAGGSGKSYARAFVGVVESVRHPYSGMFEYTIKPTMDRADAPTFEVSGSDIIYLFKRTKNPGQLLSGMLAFLAEHGDARVLKIESGAGAESGSKVLSLPDDAEAGLGSTPNGGDLFFIRDAYGEDLGKVSSVTYKGKTYRLAIRFENDYLSMNLIFTTTGKAGDAKKLWLRSDETIKIDGKDHTILRIIALPN